MKITVLLTLFVAVAISSGAKGSILPLHKNGGNNNAITNDDATANFGTALFNYIMAFQKIMPCGFSNWNLPPLAPFTLDNFPFDYNNQYYRVNGTITNMVISGMNDFRILKFNYNQNTGKITYDIIYYGMQMLGEYTVDAWAMIAGYKATMVGNGPLNWQVKDIRAFGEVTMGPNGGDGSMISDYYMNFLVGDVINDSWNYKWDIAFNNFVNQWFPALFKMWVEQAQAEVNDFYNNRLLPVENQNLENVNMNEIISFFIQQTQLMNEANCQPTQS